MPLSKDPGFFAALAIVLGLCLWRLGVTEAVTGDVAMYLQCGRLILDGQSIYVDFFDLNPPLVFFVSVLPAALAKISGLPLLFSGSIACGALSVFSILSTWRVLSGFEAVINVSLRSAFLLALAAVPAFVTYDYGQREHLLMLVWIPYFFLRFRRICSKDGAVHLPTVLPPLLGFLAGLGLCFKPYFLLMPLVLELSLLLERRSIKNVLAPEIYGLVAAGAAYAVGLMLLPPASRTYLFGYLMPLLSAGYSAFDSGSLIVFMSTVWIPTLVLAWLAMGASGYWGRTAVGDKAPPWQLRVLHLSLAAQVIVDFALIQIQHKGWCYHGIPLMVTSLCLLALGLQQLAERHRIALRVQFFAALATVIVAVTFSSIWLVDVHKRLHTEWEAIVPRLAPVGSRVAYLDTTDTPWFVQSAKREIWPGARYLWLYPVPIYENLLARHKVDQAAVDREITAMTGAIVADLDKYKTPLVVLKTTNCYGLPASFDMHQYLSKYGLKDALANYEQVEKTQNYLFFKRVR